MIGVDEKEPGTAEKETTPNNVFEDVNVNGKDPSRSIYLCVL